MNNPNQLPLFPHPLQDIYNSNIYASKDRMERLNWKRKNKIPTEDLIGMQIFFVPYSHMNMNAICDLTPNKLYTIRSIDKWERACIRDDSGATILVAINKVCYHIDCFPFFFSKRDSKRSKNKKEIL